jgi:hypothetical protein
MGRAFDTIVTREPEDNGPSVDSTGGDEKYLPAVHGVEVQLARQSVRPGLDVAGRIEARPNRPDRIAVRLGDRFYVRGTRLARLEYVNAHQRGRV